MKDRAAGVAISHEAVAWAAGKREPSDPLPAVDGQPHNDFSKSIDRFISKSLKTVEKQEAEIAREPKVMHMEPVIYGPPNACGTCTYFVNMSNYDYHKCSAHGMLAKFARPHASFCNNGQSWRPEAGEINKIKAIYAVAERVFLHALETQLSIACPGEKFGRSTILKSLLLPSRAKS